MKISRKEYDKMISKASPSTKSYKTIPTAFLVGGLICAFGEFLFNIYRNFGLDIKTSRAWVSITLVFLSILLTALKVFDKIGKYAGAGTLVPITGFANSIAAPAIEFKNEGHVLGLGAKMFVIAGPVLVFGTVSSVIYGIILWIFKLYK